MAVVLEMDIDPKCIPLFQHQFIQYKGSIFILLLLQLYFVFCSLFVRLVYDFKILLNLQGKLPFVYYEHQIFLKFSNELHQTRNDKDIWTSFVIKHDITYSYVSFILDAESIISNKS